MISKNYLCFRVTGLIRLTILFCSLLLLAGSGTVFAQFSSFSGANKSTDTSRKKTNTGDWDETDAYMYMTRPFSDQQYFRDSGLHTLHRRPFNTSWYRDLGNQGSPARNLQFMAQHPAGLSLGYPIYDAQRWHPDSVWFYNTTRPFSNFTYHLGSKQEQLAEILHTQNIKPYWNIAAAYRKATSPGYYLWQRNATDNAFISSNYTDPGLRYKLYVSFVYNKVQHDENGGIVSDTFLNNPQYAERKAVPVNFYTASYTNTNRSPVRTFLRDWNLRLEHAYTWGRKDTLYNEDSTAFEPRLQARFRISHQLNVGSQRFRYKDMKPDSLRYVPIFNSSFASNDSVFSQQEWLYVDNRFLLNGILGAGNRQWVFSAGAGNRIDRFQTDFLSGRTADNSVSNYVQGILRKEAVAQRQWDIAAQIKLFVTGPAMGNLSMDGRISKDFDRLGRLSIGASQQINNAPYNYTIFQNQFWKRTASFSTESTTQLYAQYDLPQYQLSAAFRNFLLSNYLYFDASQSPGQYGTAFALSQLSLRKQFRAGRWVLDNEVLYQLIPQSAPVNLPALLGRHQLSLESYIFKRKLQIATGLEFRYHSAYDPALYSPYFNQFYYQSGYRLSAQPDASVFFNFRIKRFRAFLMFDRLTQFGGKNVIITKGYTAQDAMLRFGFQWVMIN